MPLPDLNRSQAEMVAMLDRSLLLDRVLRNALSMAWAFSASQSVIRADIPTLTGRGHGFVIFLGDVDTRPRWFGTLKDALGIPPAKVAMMVRNLLTGEEQCWEASKETRKFWRIGWMLWRRDWAESQRKY